MAGILAAATGNGTGVAAASGGARLVPIKVTDDNNQARASTLIAAYEWILAPAQEHGIRVVNVSLTAAVDPSEYAGETTGRILLDKIDEARAAGIVTVAAAGNGAASGAYDVYPGDYAGVVSVIGLMQDEDAETGVVRNPDSNRNKEGEAEKNISAPGTSILTTAADGGYTTVTGTSMAAPQVSSALALIFAADPSLTADEAVQILYDTALDLGEAGFDEEYGHGMAMADAAVREALGLEPAGCDIPEPEP